MSRPGSAAACFFLVTCAALPAWAQCTKDIECKGDRVCEDGRCISPSPPSPPQPPPPSDQGRACLETRAGLDCGAPVSSPVPEPSHTSDVVVETAGSGWSKGFELSVWSGYMVPMGSLVTGVALSDSVSGGIPLGLELGGRVNRHWFVGLQGIGGLGLPMGGFLFSVGPEVAYHFRPPGGEGIGRTGADPWMALGVGYERLDVAPPAGAPGSGGGSERDYSGIQLLDVRLGLDHLLRPGGKAPPNAWGWGALPPPDGLGLFLGLRAGMFATSGNDTPALHGWLTLGAKVTWDAGR